MKNCTPYISNRAMLEERFIGLMNRLRSSLDPDDPKNAIYQYFADRAKKNRDRKIGLTVQGRMSFTIQTIQHNMRDNLLGVKFSADASSGDIRSYALICSKLGISLDHRILDAMRDPEGDVYGVIRELSGLDADRRTVKFVTLAILNGASNTGVWRYCMSAGCNISRRFAEKARTLIYNLLHAEEYNSWIYKNVRISSGVMSFVHPLLDAEFKCRQTEKYKAFNYIIAQVTSRINEYVLQSCLDDSATGPCVIGEIHDAVEFIEGCSMEQIMQCVSDGLDLFCADYGCDRSLLRYSVEEPAGSEFEWIYVWYNGFRFRAYVGHDDRKRVRVGLVIHGAAIRRIQEYEGKFYDKYQLDCWIRCDVKKVRAIREVRAYKVDPDRVDPLNGKSLDDIDLIYNESAYADQTARLSGSQYLTDIGYKIRGFISDNKHSVIIGNTGTGKSTFIKDMVSRDESVRVFVLRNNNKLNHLDEDGESYAQNIDAWKTIKSIDDAAMYGGCTVVIDEAHMLFSDHAYRSCVEGLGWILKHDDIRVVFVSATFTDAMLAHMKRAWGCRVFSITKDTERKIHRELVLSDDPYRDMLDRAMDEHYDAVLLHTDEWNKKLMYRLAADGTITYDHWICRESYDAGFCVEACSKEYMFEGVYIGTQYAEQGIDGRLGGARRVLVISNVSRCDELDLCRMVQVEGRFRNAEHIDHIILFNQADVTDMLDICDITARNITDLEQVDILCINQFRALINSVYEGPSDIEDDQQQEATEKAASRGFYKRAAWMVDKRKQIEGVSYMESSNPHVALAPISKKMCMIISTVLNMDIPQKKKRDLLWHYKDLEYRYDHIAHHNRDGIAKELGVQSIFTIDVIEQTDPQTGELMSYHTIVKPLLPAAYRFLETMSSSMYVRWVKLIVERSESIYEFKAVKESIMKEVKGTAYSRAQVLEVIARMEKAFGCRKGNVYSEHFVPENNPFESDEHFREEHPETLREMKHEIPIDDIWWDFKGYRKAGWMDCEMQIVSPSGIFMWYDIHCVVMAALSMMDKVEQMPLVKLTGDPIAICGEMVGMPAESKKRDQKGKAVGKAVHVRYKDTITGSLYDSMGDAIAAIAPELAVLRSARQMFSKKYAGRVIKIWI